MLEKRVSLRSYIKVLYTEMVVIYIFIIKNGKMQFTIGNKKYICKLQIKYKKILLLINNNKKKSKHIEGSGLFGV